MSDPEPAAGAGPPRDSIMNRIVASSLHQRLLIALLAVVLIGAGWRSLVRLPVDAYPDLSPPSWRSSRNGRDALPRRSSG